MQLIITSLCYVSVSFQSNITVCISVVMFVYVCVFFWQIVKKIAARKSIETEKVYNGVGLFKEGVKLPLPLESIPGLVELGWKPLVKLVPVRSVCF